MPRPPDDPLNYWQELLPPEGPIGVVSEETFAANLPDGSRLLLPIRRLPQRPDGGLASLIINQASLKVEAALCGFLADTLRPYSPDLIVAVPSLGLIAGRGVAQSLGHERYAPLGVSRKFWYADELSVDLNSITSPGKSKRLYIDPRMVPLIAGKRLAIVDDVISSGTSILAALDLLSLLDATIVAIGVVMRQTQSWRVRLQEHYPDLVDKVVGVFDTPLLCELEGRWATPEDQRKANSAH